MGHSARLQKHLTWARGVTAAAGAVAALLIAPGNTGAAGGTAWTKAWAEHEVREHFDAVTAVCLPLGKATHDHGSKAFAEFVCVFTTGDGSRYTIHLKPRTRTTWATVSFKKLGKPAPKAGRDAPVGGSHATGGEGGGGPGIARGNEAAPRA